MNDGHQEILLAIGRLEGKVDAINRRLDITNGRVAKSEEKISTLQIDGAVGKTKIGFIGAIGGLVASAVIKMIFK